MKWTILTGHSDALYELDLTDDLYINISALSLDDLTTRRITYTQAISLPKTPNNIRAFDYFDGIRYGDPNTHPWPCVVLLDGQKIVDSESLIYIESVTQDAIKCQIVSREKDIFAVMDETPMADIIASRAIKHTSIVSGILRLAVKDKNGKQLFSIKTIYPFTQNDIKPGDADEAEFSGKEAYNVLPALNVRDILTDIAFYHGWEVAYKNHATAAMENYYIPCVNLHEQYHYSFSGQWNALAKEVNLNTIIYNTPLSGWVNSNIDSLGRTGILNNGTTPVYYALDTQICNVSLAISCSRDITSDQNQIAYHQGIAIEAIVRVTDKDGEPIQEHVLSGYAHNYWLPTTPANTYVTLKPNRAFRINAGEQLRFTVYVIKDMPINASVTVTATARVNFTTGADTETNYGGITQGATVNLLDCMNFETQGDFVRAVIQTFALLPQFDYTNKRIYFTTFQEVRDNLAAGNVVDWSDKLVEDGDVEFSYGLDGVVNGTNYINFKKNESDYQTGWSFQAYSASLDNGPGEYMELPFAASENVTTNPSYNGLKLANLPLNEVENTGSSIDRTYKGTDDKFLLYILPTMTINSIIKSGSKEISRTLYAGRFQTTPIEESFSALTSAMMNPVKLRAQFLLTPLDIMTIDLMKPVRIEQYGAFFYISAIENYSGGIVTCELIKL
jgi:hypothetical protein